MQSSIKFSLSQPSLVVFLQYFTRVALMLVLQDCTEFTLHNFQEDGKIYWLATDHEL